MAERDIVDFGGFRLHLAEGSLSHRGEPVRMQQKAYELLVLLATHPGILYSSDELRAALWPGVTVTEQSVRQAIRRVRSVLSAGDEDAGVSLVTVARRGYRLVLPEPEPDASIDDGALQTAWESGARVLTLTGGSAVAQLADRRSVTWERVNLDGSKGLSDLYAAMAEALNVRFESTDRDAELGQALRARGTGLLWLDRFDPKMSGATAALASWCTAAPETRFALVSTQPGRAPAEPGIMQQCRIFRGGFTVDAAEAIVVPEAGYGVAEQLSALVDAGHIAVEEVSPGVRRLFLVAGAGEHHPDSELRHRYFRYYAFFGTRTFLDSLDTGPGPRRRALSLERLNLVSATAWAVASGDAESAASACRALSTQLAELGMWPEMLERVQTLDRLALGVADRIDLWLIAARAHGGNGDHDPAIDLCRRSIEAALQAEHHYGLVVAHELLADQLFRTSEPLLAEAALREGLRNAETSRLSLNEANILRELGALCGRDGRHDEGLTYLRRALALHERTGNRRGRSAAHRQAADILRRRGRLDEARWHDEQGNDPAPGKA